MFAEVQSVEALSPTMLRVTLAGGTLDQFEASSATDAYINARFLPQDSPLAVPFDDDAIAAVASEHRPRPRRFTVRRWEEESNTMIIDFVAHGDVGYAGAWAARAVPGDRLQFTGPGGSYQPSPDVDWHLFVGDESAFGGIGASLERLTEGERALVFVVVDSPDHEVDFPTSGDVHIVWLYRDASEAPEELLVDAVAAAEFPTGTFDVFVHGEAGEVRAVRRHLVAEHQVDVGAASISPYWRRKHTDEAWRSIKREWLAEQANDV
ncbi:MAG: siderophore-interacting protein [Actinomycetota bacterium]